MTVPVSPGRSGPYNGNGVTTVFEYKFKIRDKTHLLVIKRGLDGKEHTLNVDTDYIVSDVGHPQGSIALVTPPATGETITILRDVPFSQETDLENQGAYYAETVEEALDLAAMRDQQMQEQITRSIKIPPSADPSDLDELIGNVLRMADSADNIDTVAGHIANVDTVAANIGDVNTVAGDIADVRTVAANITNVNKVAAVDADVSAVSANAANINTVAANIGDVNTVSGGIADVSTVATNISDVTDVAGDMVNIDTVASDIANINSVAGDISNVNAVAGASADIATLAPIASDIQAVAANIPQLADKLPKDGSEAMTGALMLPQIPTPATPGAGLGKLYFKNKKPYALGDDGQEYDLTAGGGGGGEIAVAADLSELAATSTVAYKLATLVQSGRSGVFRWVGSNLSAQVAGDPQQGVYVAPTSDTTGASGAWVRVFENAVNVKWFGAVGNNSTDDTAAFAAAFDYVQGFSVPPPVYVPTGTYKITSGLSITSHWFTLIGDGNGSKLNWTATAGWLFTVGLGTGSALLGFEVRNVWINQVGVPTSGGFFNLQLVGSGVTFENVRTDNAFIHYNCIGLTRASFVACKMYGSTLFPLGTPVAGTAFMWLDSYNLGGGNFRDPANILMSACELSGNSAEHKNMAYGIYIRCCDGLFVDSSSYIGLAGNANVLFQPSRPAAPLVNNQIDAFIDGGQDTTLIGVQFSEPSAGYHTAVANSNVIGGIISGCKNDGVLVNIQSLKGLDIRGRIKACGYGVRVLSGGSINCTASFDNNVSSDIYLAGSGSGFSCVGSNISSAVGYHVQILGSFDVVSFTGCAFTGAVVADFNITTSGTKLDLARNSSDKSGTANAILSAAAITIPAVGDTFVISGTTNIHTLNGGWPGRMVTLIFASGLTVQDKPAGNLNLASDFATTNASTITLVKGTGADWVEVARSKNT